MNPEEAHAEAVRRIERARAEGAAWLDLGDLPLEALPEELARLDQLRLLALGRHALRLNQGQVEWVIDDTRPYQKFHDLGPLAGLTALEGFDLRGANLVADLQPLAPLTKLRRLDLRHTAVADLRPLAGATSLEELSLVECYNLSDLGPLAGLANLRILRVNVTKVRDLGPLAHLGRPRHFHAVFTAVSDLGPLAGLVGLEALNLYGSAANDLGPLAGLAGLRKLDLAWCDALRDLGPIAGLTNLCHLNLVGCQNLRSFAPVRGLLPALRTLLLDLCSFDDLPAEVCGGDNAIDRVRAHFADLEQGSEDDAEMRLLVLGNGGVGKTQLCRRLQGQPFDPGVPSTHGVQLGGFALSLQECGKPVQVRFWDFGGQDIYHGTHALFLNSHAVFVVVWHPDHEQGETAEYGVTMRNRPLAYWLDYIRALAGSEAPVLVVQGQCDEPRRRVKPPAVPADDFRSVKFLEVSARTDLGIDALLGQIKESVRDLLAARPLQTIGVGRRQVRDRLRDLLGEGRTRLLTRAEFQALCDATGKVSDPDALLDFLHHAGVVFHRPGLFQGHILLDQAWALDAIYTLFHRRDALPYLFRDGRFTRQLLAQLTWGDRSVEEQETLLGMMESCGICFRTRNLAAEGERPTWEYVAPDLLPEWSAARGDLLGRLRDGEPDDQATVRFAFLHEGVLRTFLSAIGRRAGDVAVYWKYGCWFAEATTGATVLIQSRTETDAARPGKGEVDLQAWGAGATALLDRVLRALLEVRIGQPPEVVRRGRPSRPVAADGEGRGVEALCPARRDRLPDDGRRRVYASYAWGDDTPEGRRREDLVDRLCARLRDWGYEVLRDRDAMRRGESIAAFMKTLGRSERIVVVLSAKYLRSPYCMTELYEIYRYSRGEKDDFLRRIVPLTLDAPIAAISQRAGHARFWRQQHDELLPCVADLGPTDLAAWARMRTWATEVSEMLAHISDTLHAVGFDAIVADDFAAVRELLDRPA